jgi:hypothetical protein
MTTPYHGRSTEFLVLLLLLLLLLLLQIKYWVTINEPASICDHGYKNGIYAPGVKGDKTALYKYVARSSQIS